MPIPSQERIADALVLTFTEGVSLAEWERSGLLEREWALYRALAPHYGRILLVTWGTLSDAPIAQRLGADLICNERALGPGEFAAEAATRVTERLRALNARSAVVKSNQMPGGEVAIAVTTALRQAGITSGLIARGGYHWSRFAAWEHGPTSNPARQAADREASLCRAADLIVGTTRAMTDDLCWRHAIDAGKATIIPNYVDAPAPSRNAPPASGPTEILFAGRLVKQKRVDLLIDAVAALPRDLKNNLRLTVIGEGPLEQDLRAQASRLNITAEFLPRIPHAELLARMSSPGIYCQASAYEGHPKTVLEAMTCGRAVVVTDTPGLREVINDARTGLVADSTPQAIAASLELLLRDPNLAHALGQAAAAHARERYSLRAILPQELAAHRTALARGREASSTAPPVFDTSTAVRFDPILLSATTNQSVEAWTRSIRGFSRRLAPKERATFLAALDTPIYHLQGETAVEANGGLHPKHRLMRYHDFFVDRIKPGERIIDLGCGVGALAASIAEHARAHVTGMDWTQKNLDKAAAIAAKRTLTERLRYTLGDITRDRADGTYSAVVLSNVLEHLQNRAELLRTWQDWYGASRFLIRVPAFDREWRTPWKKELGVEWRLDPTHETEYTQAQLEGELRAAGLKVRELIIRWGEYWAVATPA
jgi:SAM-dependent methyltransferase